MPCLFKGTGPPPEFAPSQVRRWSTWASVSIVACGLVLLGLTRQAVRTNVNVSKVVALSDQGYDCLGKAEVLDDKGKQWLLLSATVLCCMLFLDSAKYEHCLKESNHSLIVGHVCICRDHLVFGAEATYSDESALSSSPLMDGDWHDVHEQTLPVHHIWTNTANAPWIELGEAEQEMHTHTL
eukprot:g7310.t1